MARPRKTGIDYFPFDTDFFSDKKIRILKSRFGADGITIYVYLLCEIYKNGYYVRIDDDYEYIIADDLGMSNEKVKQIMRFLLERSLLNSKLFQSDNVITSAGIQRRFQEAVKKRACKLDIEVEKKYWILSEEETQPFIRFTQNPSYSEKNPSYSEKNPSYSEKNDTKESKVKKSKVNKNIMCKADALALFESLWKLYPNKKGKGQVSDAAKRRLLDIGLEEITRAIERYKVELQKDDWRRPQNGSTFFNSGYVDYLDANYEPGKPKSSKPSGNQFNQFEQNDYDFDAMERELRAN